MNKPLITIITVNFNNSSGLKKTIESVVKQTYSFIDFIIIDGNSSDGSVDIIKNNEEKISYWVSEKDNGVYDAMNKGIEKATGDYCLFLNSGDTLYHDKVIENILQDLSNTDLIYGDIYIELSQKFSVISSFKSKKISRWFFISTNGLPHQATFIKTTILKKNQPAYKTDFTITADHEFFSRSVLIDKASLKYTPNIITNYGITGMSCKMKNSFKILRERFKISRSYLNKTILAAYYIYYVPKFLIRTIIRNLLVSILNKG